MHAQAENTEGARPRAQERLGPTGLLVVRRTSLARFIFWRVATVAIIEVSFISAAGSWVRACSLCFSCGCGAF